LHFLATHFLFEAPARGVQTQRRRVFDAENRRLRGQKGMVDADEFDAIFHGK